ncbi:MAG: peptide chain release factor N(5)-glutamine methyltransferase [Nitrospirae bacterium]|nr:MAG: peptide chain release factor N(5)-glutamine methyltransferase [Nitrospirota bacterium]
MSAGAAAAAVTVGDLRRQARALLKGAGIVNAARETDWLLAFALDVPSHVLMLEGARAVSALQAEQARVLAGRRAAREPLQYLLGTQEFRGLDIAVAPAVLIPRPESELLVEETLRAVAGIAAPVLADVGTGSGCIAVAIACERPDATVYALDVSAPALAVARSNAIRHGAGDRIRFIRADLLEALGGARAFDAIVSNPPYIPEQEVEGLQPEVARYEPRVALAAGPDGLAFYRRLLHGAPPLLKPGGSLVMELGCGQAEAVTRMALQNGAFDSVECRKDMAGIERVLVARKVGTGGARCAGPPPVLMVS